MLHFHRMIALVCTHTIRCIVPFYWQKTVYLSSFNAASIVLTITQSFLYNSTNTTDTMASIVVIFYHMTNNRDFGEATYLQLCEDWRAQFEAAYEQLNAELDTDTTSIHDLERQLEHNIDMAVREGVPNNAEGLRRIQTAYPLLRRQAELEDHRRQVIAQLDKLQIAEATTRKLDTQDDRDLWVLEGYYLHYIRRRIDDRVWTGTAEMNLLYSVATSVSDGDPIDTKPTCTSNGAAASIAQP